MSLVLDDCAAESTIVWRGIAPIEVYGFKKAGKGHSTEVSADESNSTQLRAIFATKFIVWCRLDMCQNFIVYLVWDG
jgi:hypothetical protein